MKTPWLVLAAVTLAFSSAAVGYRCGSDDSIQGLCLPVGGEAVGDSVIPADWRYRAGPDAIDAPAFKFLTGEEMWLEVEVEPYLAFSDTDLPDPRIARWILVERGEQPFILWRRKYGSAIILEFAAPHPSKPLAHIFLSGKSVEDRELIARVIGLRNALAEFVLRHGIEGPQDWRKVGEDPMHDSER